METILAIIGLFVVIKFFIRHRRLIMDRKVFFEAVKDLRQGIVKGYSNEYQHSELDKIVKCVVGDNEMENIDDEQIAETVIRLIKRIKQSKENEQLTAKAKEIVEKIKAEIEN